MSEKPKNRFRFLNINYNEHFIVAIPFVDLHIRVSDRLDLGPLWVLGDIKGLTPSTSNQCL